VPAGTLLFYSPYMSHRDPDSFEHPDAFDPERWTTARGEKRPSPARLFGFGGGPRVCLGKAFAKLQLRLMVRAILRRHQIALDPLARPKIQGLPVHHPVGARVVFTPIASAKEVSA
jgi:cytochrome P450